MGNARGARRQPTQQPQLLPDLATLSRAEIIHLYHTLQKRLASLQTDTAFVNHASKHAHAQLLSAQLRLIGLHKYQQASRNGELIADTTFDCSQWVLTALKRMSFDAESVRLLDVGAIVPRFPPRVFTADGTVELRHTAIDLHPEQSERGNDVLQADLIHYAQPSSLHSTFDVVCLSLCLNFEGCPTRRALMLQSANCLLKHGATLFLTLPAACVQNSRHLDQTRLRQILLACGFAVTRLTFSNKLMLCVAAKCTAEPMAALHKRIVLRPGASRNNFFICVRPDNATLPPRARAPQSRKKRASKLPSLAVSLRGAATKRSSRAARSTSNQRRRARNAAARSSTN
ncbi:unnamed protein product [Agarophyton chilense]